MFTDVVEVAKPLLEEEYLLSFDGKTFDKTFDKLVDQDYNLKLGKLFCLLYILDRFIQNSDKVYQN